VDILLIHNETGYGTHVVVVFKK